MGRRSVHIPRGDNNEAQYSEIRNNLINRIKNIENSGTVSKTPVQGQVNNKSQSVDTVSNQQVQNSYQNNYKLSSNPINNNSYKNTSYANRPLYNNTQYGQFQQNQNPANQANFAANRNQSYNQYGQINSTQNTFQTNSQPAFNVSDPYKTNSNSSFETPSQRPNFRSTNEFANANHSDKPTQYKPKQRKSFSKSMITLLLMVALIFGLAWALREFVFQAYEIPSGSMEKTIMTGDMVFAEKVSHHFGLPKRGETITFTDPLNPGRILIKRVVATEGQTVNIVDNKLYIDGEEINETYVNGLPTTKLKSSKISYPYTVPDGHVWVMGDNRTNSQDSRYFGSIDKDSIIGRALFVYWPLSDAKILN